MTSLAVAKLELVDAWSQFEDALSHWSDPDARVSEKAQAWWIALREFLLQDA